MTYNLNNKTRYTVWACTPDQPDRVYATGLSEWDADMVVNEMNSIDDTVDYRMGPETEDAIVMDAFQEHVVLSNQEWNTPDYYIGLRDFQEQVHMWLLGEDVPPNSCYEVPYSLVESVGKQLRERAIQSTEDEISELYSEYISHITG